MDFVDNNANQKDLTIEIGNNISIGLISGYGIYREVEVDRCNYYSIIFITDVYI